MRGWRATLVLGGGAALLLAGYALWTSTPIDSLPADGVEPSAGTLAQSTSSVAARSASPGPAPMALAPSLAGTEPDGALVLDEFGAFVPSPDALDFFDYYLAAFGEQPFEQIVANIEREIRARADPPDAALELLERYLAYRDEVRALVETEGIDALPLERRLQRLREIRRGVFGPELAATLFEEEEARARAAIEWREIALDPELGPEERAERLAALEAALPEAERELRARVSVASRLLEQEGELREDGASEAEIDSMREQEFGAEAAARLAALDRARAEWRARVAHYRAERERLSAQAFDDPAEANDALEALQTSLFEGPELLRIRALDESTLRAGP